MNEIKNKLTKYNFSQQLKKLEKKYKSKKIILYGTGKFFETIISNYDLSKLNIIAVSDLKYKNIDEETCNGYKIVAPQNIHLLKPHIVLLALENDYYVEKYFYENLFKETGKKFKYKPILKIPLSVKIQEEWERT